METILFYRKISKLNKLNNTILLIIPITVGQIHALLKSLKLIFNYLKFRFFTFKTLLRYS